MRKFARQAVFHRSNLPFLWAKNWQLALFQVYHNFVLPHTSLRQPLPQPLPTKGKGSARTWRPCTPSMTAGLTDGVWTLRAVLMFRVPPWPQPASL